MTTDLPAQVPLSAGLGRWVSVRERLPDSDDAVLVYTPKNAHAKVWIDRWQMQREAGVFRGQMVVDRKTHNAALTGRREE